MSWNELNFFTENHHKDGQIQLTFMHKCSSLTLSLAENVRWLFAYVHTLAPLLSCSMVFSYFVTIFPHIKVDDWVLMVCRLDRKLFAAIIDFWWRNFRIVGSVCDIIFACLLVWCCARGRFCFCFVYFYFVFTSFANILSFFLSV